MGETERPRTTIAHPDGPGANFLREGMSMGIRWDGAERRKGERRQTRQECGEMHEDWTCTEDRGHRGEHVARGWNDLSKVYARWPNITESEARALDGNR